MEETKQPKTNIWPILITVFVLLVVSVGVVMFNFLKIKTVSQPNTSTGETKTKSEINALTIYHWWQSGGELAAINSLTDLFSKKYPETAVMSSLVQGGGGMEMIAKIKPMILSNEAPDSFVAHPGYEIYPYIQENLLQPLDNIWETEKLTTLMPQALQDMSKVGDHFYVIPLDIHRNNLLWYNQKLLTKHNIDPKSIMTWESLFKACDKLKKEGVQYPIQIARSWTVSFVFNNMILGQGVPFYEDFVNGKITSETDPKLLSVLNNLKKYLSYSNLDSSKIEWNIATERVIEGESAFNIMGDWANGDFKLIGMKYGKDYGAISVPETDGLHLLVVDGFVKPNGISHSSNADNWLKLVGSREGQDTFNPKKGSISGRKDVNKSLYDEYQQTAISYFQKAKLVIDTGSALPYDLRNELNTIMENFVKDKNVEKAALALTNYTKNIQSQFKIKWSIK